ncbi:MAG TPA: alcohol dehydrogenase catalytic domain-containing protein [Baekduia sp.]|nr:alcohol dehydrogenase catalytic domain-containing protein [Baekduia sp.]
MRAARSVGVREVRVEQVDEPVPDPGEVVAAVLACGVCGSDVSDAWVAPKLPVVLGHELTAEVLEVGAGVAGVAPGDRVVVHHHAPCGRCRACARGRETLCDRFRATQLDPGGFAERVRIPAELVPELLPLHGVGADAGTFVEPLACVLRALDRCRVGPSDRLLVLGAGTSGLLAVAAARTRDVEALWVREPRAGRRARAVALGAAVHDGEAVDVALCCTAAPAAIADAFAALGPGGILGLYAPPAPGAALGLDGHALYRREVEVVPSYSAGPADMRAALALVASGAVDPLPFVTHRLGLEETGRALELARTGEALKALVLP